MTATPDGISMGDLLKLQEQAAASSAVNEPTGPHCGLTDQQVLDLADKLVDELGETCPAPEAVKALLLETLNRMIGWHTQVGYDIVKKADGDIDAAKAAVCWLRDAGKFQSMANILCTISMGDDEFLDVD